jgi:hypothetical protein
VADEQLPEIGQIAVHKAHLLIQPPGETTTELLLKYQHQDWMLRSNTRTTKTEIPLFLNVE